MRGCHHDGWTSITNTECMKPCSAQDTALAWILFLLQPSSQVGISKAWKFRAPGTLPLSSDEGGEVGGLGDHRQPPLYSATGVLMRAGLATCSHTQGQLLPRAGVTCKVALPDFESSQHKSCTHSSLLAKWVIVLHREAITILSHSRPRRPVGGNSSLKGKVVLWHSRRRQGGILIVPSGLPTLQAACLEVSFGLIKIKCQS